MSRMMATWVPPGAQLEALRGQGTTRDWGVHYFAPAVAVKLVETYKYSLNQFSYSKGELTCVGTGRASVCVTHLETLVTTLQTLVTDNVTRV